MRTCCVSGLQNHLRIALRASRGIRAGAVQPASFLGDCPPKALETVQTIREAVAHSTTGPYADIASEETLIINPPWADEPRATVTQPLVKCCSGVPRPADQCAAHSFAFSGLIYRLRVVLGCMFGRAMAALVPVRAFPGYVGTGLHAEHVVHQQSVVTRRTPLKLKASSSTGAVFVALLS